MLTRLQVDWCVAVVIINLKPLAQSLLLTKAPLIRSLALITRWQVIRYAGASKFLPDGSVETESGTKGNWKLFDKDSQTYIINIDGAKIANLFNMWPGEGFVPATQFFSNSLNKIKS